MSKCIKCLCGFKDLDIDTHFGHAIITCKRCSRSTGTLYRRRQLDEAYADWNFMNRKEIKNDFAIGEVRLIRFLLDYEEWEVEDTYRNDPDNEGGCTADFVINPVCWNQIPEMPTAEELEELK